MLGRHAWVRFKRVIRGDVCINKTAHYCTTLSIQENSSRAGRALCWRGGARGKVEIEFLSQSLTRQRHTWIRQLLVYLTKAPQLVALIGERRKD